MKKTNYLKNINLTWDTSCHEFCCGVMEIGDFCLVNELDTYPWFDKNKHILKLDKNECIKYKQEFDRLIKQHNAVGLTATTNSLQVGEAYILKQTGWTAIYSKNRNKDNTVTMWVYPG